MNIQDRQFLYVKDLSTREQLRDAWHAITFTQSWDDIQHNDYLSKSDIYSILDRCGSTSHSGASFAACLSSMRFLALYGEHTFRRLYEK